MKESDISVVLCSYNGARFIERQLESIIGQSTPPTQIVLSDDSSRDGTVEVARAVLRNNDWRGSTIVTRNPGARGVVANFSHGLSLATGGLIALSDQDDSWRPDKLERMLRPFQERSELLLLHSNARLVDERGVPTGGTLFDSLRLGAHEQEQIHSGKAFDALLRRNFVTGATAVIRSELLATALPVPDGWLHDEWLAIVAAATGELDFVDEPLIDYRQHSSNEVGARLLSAGAVVQRFSEPRQPRNARLLARAEALPDRIAAFDTIRPPDGVELAREKLKHERKRSALPAGRFRRILPIVEEVRTGRYRRFGNGLGDALRDLLQPAGGERR